MTDIFAIETSTRSAGFPVRAEAGFRFYATDRTFSGLEQRRYRRIEDIYADVQRLADGVATTRFIRRNRKRDRNRLSIS